MIHIRGTLLVALATAIAATLGVTPSGLATETDPSFLDFLDQPVEWPVAQFDQVIEWPVARLVEDFEDDCPEPSPN